MSAQNWAGVAGTILAVLVLAAGYLIRRERHRRHLIEVHYGAALYLFPEHVREAMAQQVAVAHNTGARGRGISITPVPGVGAAWMRVDLTDDGGVHHSAGYARSVRAARRQHDVT